jgi:hypothetical protein
VPGAHVPRLIPICLERLIHKNLVHIPMEQRKESGV